MYKHPKAPLSGVCVRNTATPRHLEYMREKFNTYTLTRPRLKKVVGWLLVVIGFLALITPLTPGGILFFVGLEILGLRIIFTDKMKRLFVRRTQKSETSTIPD